MDLLILWKSVVNYAITNESCLIEQIIGGRFMDQEGRFMGMIRGYYWILNGDLTAVCTQEARMRKFMYMSRYITFFIVIQFGMVTVLFITFNEKALSIFPYSYNGRLYTYFLLIKKA